MSRVGSYERLNKRELSACSPNDIVPSSQYSPEYGMVNDLTGAEFGCFLFEARAAE